MKFRVEYMSQESFDNYMTGGYNFCVNEIDIEALDATMALGLAKASIPEGFQINEHNIRSVEEIEAEEKAWQEKIKAEEEKRERKAKEKKEWEAAHPEIVAERKRKAKITRCKCEIRKAEEEIARLQKKIEWNQKRMKELEG